jgi:hypothetical protein
MQAASDLMLGWIHTEGIDGVERDFYVRQLWHSKMSALDDLTLKTEVAAGRLVVQAGL